MNAFTANTASSIILHRSPQAYEELLRLSDLCKEEVDYYLSSEDVLHIDLDVTMLQVLIESARSSKPPMPNEVRRGIHNLTSGPQLNRDCFTGTTTLDLLCIESLTRVTVTAESHWRYEDLYSIVLKAFPSYTDEDHVHIHRLESSGCSTEVSPHMLDPTMTHVISVASLQPGQVLTLRRRGNIGVYNIGARYSQFSALHLLPVCDSEDRDRLQRTAAYLEGKNYVAFRRIRGDGNCYYRAVIFGLLEQIAMHRRSERFGLLWVIFSEVRYPSDPAAQSRHDRWLEFLKHCERESTPVLGASTSFGPMRVEQAFLQGFDLDHAAVRACRSLVSKYLKDNAHTETEGGLTMTGWCLPFYETDKGKIKFFSFPRVPVTSEQ